MTAEAQAQRPPVPARTPAGVRAALTGAHRADFERRYQAAVVRAAADYDLSPVHELVDEWWQIAVLTADPAAHQRMLDSAEALRAGRSVHGTPWAAVRTQLGV